MYANIYIETIPRCWLQRIILNQLEEFRSLFVHEGDITVNSELINIYTNKYL